MTRSFVALFPGKTWCGVLSVLVLCFLAEPLVAAPCSKPYITLKSQEEVDNFQRVYGPDCDEVTVRLSIGGADIRNLDGLINLVSVGELSIYSGSSISSLHGLSQLVTIDNHLRIRGLELVTDLSGIAALQSVGGAVILTDSPGLVTVGLGALVSAGAVSSYNNENLVAFQLDSLTQLNGLGLGGITNIEFLDIPRQVTSLKTLYVEETVGLKTLQGLENIEHIEEVYIYDNENLRSLDGLSGLISTGDVTWLINNPEMRRLELRSLESAGDYFEISRSDSLQFVDLGNLSHGVDFYIRDNASLISIEGFSPSGTEFEDIRIENNPSLLNLDVFSGIGHDIGSLGVTANTSLENLDGLIGLGPDIGGLLISGNTSLENIDGLINVFSAGGITLRGSPLISDLFGLSNLEMIGHGLTIDDFDGLIHLDDLSGLAIVAGQLSIKNNANLESVDLNSLMWTNSLTITGNIALQNLDGLDQMQTHGETLISDNESLLNIDGLTGVTGAIEDLEIIDNASLQNLDGLSNVQLIDGDLHIKGNQSLENVDGLEKLFLITGFLVEIEDNANLSSVDGLAGVAFELYRLEILDNQSLMDIGGFNDVSLIEERLDIQRNPNLNTISGFQNLESVESSLAITDNLSLQSVNGFSDLTAVHSSLFIQHNPSLSDCSAFQRLLDEIDDAEPGPGEGIVPDVGGSIRLDNNSVGCNSIFQIGGGLIKSGFE